MDNRNAFYKAPDITEQTRAAEARHLYRSLLDASDDAIFSTTLEGVITTWNRSAHRIFGYAEPEAVGHPVTLIIPPELHFEERAIQRRLTTGEHDIRDLSTDGFVLKSNLYAARSSIRKLSKNPFNQIRLQTL